MVLFRAKIAIVFKLEIKFGDISKTIYHVKNSDYLLYYGNGICYILIIQLTNVNIWKCSDRGLLLELKMSNINKPSTLFAKTQHGNRLGDFTAHIRI